MARHRREHLPRSPPPLTGDPPPSLAGHASLLRALGDERRLAIVALLSTAYAPVDVRDLIERLALPRSRLAGDLKILTNAGVVRCERLGSAVLYALELSTVTALAHLGRALAPRLAGDASASRRAD